MIASNLQDWHVVQQLGQSGHQACPAQELLLLASSLSFVSTHLKLSHERFWEKREVFEILGRVLLGIVVPKLRLGTKIIFLTEIHRGLDFHLEAVAGKDDGLLVVASQPPLNNVRLQLDGWPGYTLR